MSSLAGGAGGGVGAAGGGVAAGGAPAGGVGAEDAAGGFFAGAPAVLATTGHAFTLKAITWNLDLAGICAVSQSTVETVPGDWAA